MEWKLRTDRAVYLQIVDYIRKQIVSGEIGSGDKLLSVRELSGVLNVNPNTVQRAYAELERMGLVDTMRNIGREVTGDMDLIKQSRACKRVYIGILFKYGCYGIFKRGNT